MKERPEGERKKGKAREAGKRDRDRDTHSTNKGTGGEAGTGPEDQDSLCRKPRGRHRYADRESPEGPDPTPFSRRGAGEPRVGSEGSRPQAGREGRA